MSIVIAILLFGFMIFFHELGHFVAAKLSGIQVNEFAVFMGPPIVKWKKGETRGVQEMTLTERWLETWGP